MGQCASTAPYLQMLRHFLKAYGICIDMVDINKCIQILKEYNPWFPEEGTMDSELWLQAKDNVEKAHRQGKKIPIRFWSVWSVIFSLLRAVHGQLPLTTVQRLNGPVLDELRLDVDTKQAVHEDLKDNIYEPTPPVPVDGERKIIESPKGAVSEQPLAVCSFEEQIQKRFSDLSQQIEKLTLRLARTEANKTLQAKPKAALSLAAAALDEGDFGDYELSDDEEIPSLAVFPVIRPPPVQGQAVPARYEGINIDVVGKLKKAVTLYGPQSHYVKEMLTGVAKHFGNFAPHDWKTLARSLLKEPEYLQWNMWFSDLAAQQAAENAQSGNPNVRLISYPMLTGTGNFEDVNVQAQQTPVEIHDQLVDLAMEAWARIRPTGEHYGSWTKVMQRNNEPYVEFIARLRVVLERTVVGEKARDQLLKMLAFENANEDCRRALLPVKETGDVNAYLKACKDIGSETRKMQMFAETMVSTWKALNEKSAMKCYGCGQEGHLKRNCQKVNKEKRIGRKDISKQAPGICPKCKRGRHWARECRTKVSFIGLDQEEQAGNEQGGYLRSPKTKTEGIYFPYPMPPNTVPR
nr:group-specific antigen [Bovine retrovirus CH15]